MANVPAGQPIAPGIAASGSGYPQYGVKGSGGSYTIATADSEAQKLTDAANGYLVWFSSESAAKNYISSESSLLNGNLPNPLNWLNGLHLSWPGASTFLGRALKIVIGGVLLVAGILKMTGADKAIVPVAGAVAGRLPGV